MTFMLGSSLLPLCPLSRPLFTGFRTFSISVKTPAFCSFPPVCVLRTDAPFGTGKPVRGPPFQR